MSDDQIKWVVTADDKDVIAAFNKMNKAQQKLIEDQRKLAEESKKSEKAAKEQARSMEQGLAKNSKAAEEMGAGFVKQMAAAVTATAILNATLRVTRAEYDNIIQRQQKAGQTTITTANAEMAMLRNVSPQDHAYWRQQAPGMAQRTGQTAASVMMAIADASSAQGNQSNDQLRRNVELALRVSPDNPAEAQTIAGGLGDAVQLTGSMDERVNMGAILAMGKQARVRSTPKIAERLIPGAISVKGYGGTASEAMAINTTLSTLMNDASGEKTPGSASRIASELDRIFGEKGTPLEHITALQNNPELLKKWYQGDRKNAKASIPEHAEIAFKNLVTKGSPADQLLRSNLGGFGTDADMSQLTDDWMKSAYGGGGQKLADRDRALSQTANAAELANLREARIGAMRGRVDEVLQSTGALWTDRKLYGLKFDARTAMGDDPEQAALGTLLMHRNNLRDNPNLSERQRLNNQPAIDTLNATMRAMLDEMKGLRSDQKNSKPKNVDAHIE